MQHDAKRPGSGGTFDACAADATRDGFALPAPYRARRMIFRFMGKCAQAMVPAAMLVVILVPGVPGLAIAQGMPGTRGNAAETGRAVNAASAPSFEQLSPGNRMIAKSLLWAQGKTERADTSPFHGARWSLETISAARIEGLSWGEVFRQMKAEGLIAAGDLGEVVNGYYRPVPISTPVSASSGPGTNRDAISKIPDITRTDSTIGRSRRAHDE